MVKTLAKMKTMVVAAIKNLREIRGSTSKEIMNYILTRSNFSNAALQRKLQTTLKRGLEYGKLKKINGRYRMNEQPKKRARSKKQRDDRSATKKRKKCVKGRKTRRKSGLDRGAKGEEGEEERRGKGASSRRKRTKNVARKGDPTDGERKDQDKDENVICCFEKRSLIEGREMDDRNSTRSLSLSSDHREEADD